MSTRALVLLVNAEYNERILLCEYSMHRSYILIGAFVFFSIAFPCVCSNETLSLAADGSCAMLTPGMHGGENGQGTISMNLFDHIASWRTFLSSALPVVFFSFLLLLFVTFGRKELYVRIVQIFEFRKKIFHPPEYFDERVILSRPLLRAFYSGVLHAKISC